MDFPEDELEKELQENESMPASGNVPENPEPTDDELLKDSEPEEGDPALGRTEVEEDIQEKKGIGKKKDIKKIMQRYVLAMVFGVVGLAIFVVILIKCFDFDLVGVGNPKPKYFAPPACGKVYLTWENPAYTEARQKVEPDYVPISDPSLVDLEEEDQYGVRYSHKEYDYDTYISGIVWTDNYNAKDLDNAIVYEAMVIAARSWMISELPDNCVVLKNYNEQAQSFTELTGSEEKYSEIMQAVTASKGLIIGRNGQIISAKYDAFNYVERRAEDSASENSFFYRMMQKNNEEQQLIHASWVEKLEKEKGVKIPKVRVANSKKFASMGLYGAKYLLEREDSQYSLYRILKYYYGQDIEFYTIDYAFSEDYGLNLELGCSPISMKSTTLSREEFIALAEKYAASRGGAARLLADNAGMIYDMATSNGINPEIVLVRADVEGYSPGSSYNNFWGIGCTNTGGLAACHSYSSLSEGVSAFLKTISGYTSLGDFYKYAYLGDYWYNPGSWGKGGCPYASSIFGANIPERVRNACAAGKYCMSGSEPDCVPTTDEDRKLYGDFQARTMVSARKKIFGLSEDTCETEGTIGEPGTGSCTIWKQGDTRWGNKKLGSSNANMSGSGCAVTSIAIAISCSGVQINNVAAFNPGTLVDKMNSTGGFTGANLYWSNGGISYFAPSFRFVERVDIHGNAASKVRQVTGRLHDNTSILLHFVNEDHPRGHWVVFKSVYGISFTVYDPAYGRVNTYDASDLDAISVYRY